MSHAHPGQSRAELSAMRVRVRWVMARVHQSRMSILQTVLLRQITNGKWVRLYYGSVCAMCIQWIHTKLTESRTQWISDRKKPPSIELISFYTTEFKERKKKRWKVEWMQRAATHCVWSASISNGIVCVHAEWQWSENYSNTHTQLWWT